MFEPSRVFNALSLSAIPAGNHDAWSVVWKACLQETPGNSSGVWGLRASGITRFLVHCRKARCKGVGLTFNTDRMLVFVNSPVLCPTSVRGRQRSEMGQSGTAVIEPFTVPQGAAAKFLLPPPPPKLRKPTNA